MCLVDGWYFLFNNLFVKDNLLSIYCLFSIYDDGAHPDVYANGDTLSSLKKKYQSMLKIRGAKLLETQSIQIDMK